MSRVVLMIKIVALKYSLAVFTMTSGVIRQNKMCTFTLRQRFKYNFKHPRPHLPANTQPKSHV